MVGEVFRYELTIREGHLDAYGHVNHASYFQILEEARWEMVTQRGFGLEEVGRTKKGPIILQARVRFKKELRLRERILIETWTRNFKRKFWVTEQRIFDSSGELCTQATFTMGFMDLVLRRLIPSTERWYQAMGLGQKDVSQVMKSTEEGA